MVSLAKVEKIHQASMAILEKTGIVFHHQEALSACKKHGLKSEGEKVFFTEQKIMDLLALAPKSFEICPYNKTKAVKVGQKQTCWASTGGATTILEADSSHRQATKNDFVNLLKIGQVAPELSVLSTLVVQAGDLPVKQAAALKFFYASQLSDKVLVAVSADHKTNEMVLNTAAAIYGGLEEMRKQPRFFGIVSTISPLQLDSQAIDALIDWARAGQPSAVTPCTMAGSTGPMTLAGSIALSNAETVAGLALSQIVCPGAPVLYGYQSTTSDPRTASISIGAPEQSVFIQYGAALARYYGLPSRGGGLLTDADRVGVQSGYEAMQTGLNTRLAGFDLAMHGAGIMGGYAAVSFEQFLIDLEIINLIERSLSELEVNEKDLALKVIDELGVDGGYLTHSHTIKNCRRNFIPKFSSRGQLAGPKNDSLLTNRLNQEKKRLLSSYQPPDLSSSTIRDMRLALAQFDISGEKLF
ncbi:MAG: trimethylamine methyltransferase family protein [Deltaproteobacteria bacterium]|jgi:trimethylamine--corrinoid protein Co-methyltransferase|nr:trimethylamine methyltransferase family protein [Deltaproteobacteria bacterium]